MRNDIILELIDFELKRMDITITEERSYDYSFIYNNAIIIHDTEDVSQEDAVKRAIIIYISEVLHGN